MTIDGADEVRPPGAGHPRLVRASGGKVVAGSPEAEGREVSYLLTRAVTTLGSDHSRNIQLTGIEPEHGELRHHADTDEFVYTHVSTTGASQVNGAIVTSADLHHGDRLTVGPWTLIFQRDAHADHIRPDGGRQGGEPSGPRAAGFGGHESEPG